VAVSGSTSPRQRACERSSSHRTRVVASHREIRGYEPLTVTYSFVAYLYHTTEVWGIGGDDMGLIQSTKALEYKAPKHQSTWWGGAVEKGAHVKSRFEASEALPDQAFRATASGSCEREASISTNPPRGTSRLPPLITATSADAEMYSSRFVSVARFPGTPPTPFCDLMHPADHPTSAPCILVRTYRCMAWSAQNNQRARHGRHESWGLAAPG